MSRPEAFLEWTEWEASSNITGTDGNATVDYHFVELTSDNVTSTGTAAVLATLSDPTPGTAGILKSELAAADNGTDLLGSTATGSLSFELPLATDLTGFSVPVGHNPTVTITDNTLFEPPGANDDTTVVRTDFDSLQPFAQMDAARFQSSLESVIGALNEDAPAEAAAPGVETLQ